MMHRTVPSLATNSMLCQLATQELKGWPASHAYGAKKYSGCQSLHIKACCDRQCDAGVQGIVSIEGSSANSSLSVNVSTFISNRGRAVSSSAMSNNISNSLFKHNTAVTSGPAVYMGGSSRSIVVEKSVFSSNSGQPASLHINTSVIHFAHGCTVACQLHTEQHDAGFAELQSCEPATCFKVPGCIQVGEGVACTAPTLRLLMCSKKLI